MGKALLVNVQNTTAQLASGDETNLFGATGDSTTEAPTQVSCTEGAVFSNLRARIISGGSGTNNFRFRDAGANGNQLATRAGTGDCEDSSNTDTLTAGDLFNIAYTDTGTNSVCSWIAANVEMSSGHGNFHGAAQYVGVVYDVPSATRYFGYTGTLIADGVTNENFPQMKIRAYDTQTALQVRVTANARVNNSVFKNRINGADAGATITFGSGVTGLIEVTGLTDAIADGDTVSISVTLLTGVEDITVSFAVGTFKSSTNKSEIFSGAHSGFARTASATPTNYPIGGRTVVDTDANNRIKPGFSGIASNLRCYLSGNTYTGAGTLELVKNGSAVLTTTIGVGGGAGWYENTVDTVTFNDTDEFSFQLVGGTSGSVTFANMGITFSPPAAGGDVFIPIIGRGPGMQLAGSGGLAA
jgi:hypothetical protein